MILIDGDILVYRVGFAAQKKNPLTGEPEALPKGIACARMRDTVDGIINQFPAQETRVFLTSKDKSNFRYGLYPEYKGNRTQPKPLLYDTLRDFLLNKGAEEVFGQEADDAIGIASKEFDSIICSIDKDLDQIPGKHYNFVKGLQYDVTPDAGLKFFYLQLLQGDSTDNIPGLTGIGPKKAAAALARAATERHFFQTAKAMYQSEFKDDWETVLVRNGRLLKIRQVENELWDMPVLEEMDDQPENVPV